MQSKFIFPLSNRSKHRTGPIERLSEHSNITISGHDLPRIAYSRLSPIEVYYILLAFLLARHAVVHHNLPHICILDVSYFSISIRIPCRVHREPNPSDFEISREKRQQRRVFFVTPLTCWKTNCSCVFLAARQQDSDDMTHV